MPVVPDAPVVGQPADVTLTPREYLEIDGFSLSTPGWITNDLSQLLDDLDIRSATEILPGGTGTSIRSFPARRTVSKRDVPITIFGDVDGNGNAHPNLRYGCEANILAIRSAICAPASTMDGTRQGTLHLAVGTLAARVKVVGPLQLEAFGASNYRGIVSLELPYGPFVLVTGPPPALVTASINAGVMTLVFDRPLDPSHAPLSSGLTITVNGGAMVYNTGVTISGSTLTATFPPVVSTDLVEMTYWATLTPLTNRLRAIDAAYVDGIFDLAVTNTTPGTISARYPSNLYPSDTLYPRG